MKNEQNVPQVRFKGFTDVWEQRKLGEIFDYEQPQPYIVDSTDYDDRFETPVLTAGQSFILGYTDEKNGIKYATPQNPVIIFDDFTTSSHYVDFSFKVKSSAMKLLSLCDAEDDVYCAFNVLQNIDYIPATHERHWISIFANFDVLMPKYKKEQQQIGTYFRNLDNLITLHQRKLETLKKLKKSMLQKMFPKKGRMYPEIRFAGFTDAWEQRKLSELAEYSNGSGHEEYVVEQGKFELITLKSINSEGELVSSEKYIDEEFETLKQGTLIMMLSEQAKGMLGMTTVIPCNDRYILNQRVAALTLHDGIDGSFLTKEINNKQAYFEKMGAGTKVQNISRGHVENCIIEIPCYEEQQRIGEYFTNFDTLITLHQQKLETLKKIKKAMLQKMFV